MLGPILMGDRIPGNCHLCTEISKRRTIMQATVVVDFFPLVYKNDHIQSLITFKDESYMLVNIYFLRNKLYGS